MKNLPRLAKVGDRELHGVPYNVCDACSGKLIDRQIDAELPAKFWWAKGHVALDQDWAAGDFSTWIEQTYLWEAFGVKFAEADILAMLSKSAPPAAPNPVSSLGTVSANASRPSDRTRGRRLTHDHPYAAASAALRLVNLSPVERGKLSGPSVGKDLEEHYRAAGGKIPHEDSLDDYGASVLSALEEFWAAQGK